MSDARMNGHATPSANDAAARVLMGQIAEQRSVGGVSWRDRLQARVQRSGDDATPRAWRTYGEVLAATEEKPREWLVPDLLPFGALVLIVGHAKRAGKSTFAWALAAAAELGLPFLGHQLPRASAVILAEDGDHDLADRIRRFGLPRERGRILSRGATRGAPDLAAIVREAVQYAQEAAARILLVDTFQFWASLNDGQENDAGAVCAALRPLQEAADAGLLVLLVHHVGKREGVEGGVAARGSTAFAGTVEATLELRAEGDGSSTRRRLHVESRFGGVRDLIIDLQGGAYAVVGEAAQIEREGVQDAVLDWLRANPGWHRKEDVAAGCGRRGGDVATTLPALARDRRLRRDGAGRPGSPYLYAALGTPNPTADASTVPQGSPSVPGNGSTDGGGHRSRRSPPLYERGNGNGDPARGGTDVVGHGTGNGGDATQDPSSTLCLDRGSQDPFLGREEGCRACDRTYLAGKRTGGSA